MHLYVTAMSVLFQHPMRLDIPTPILQTLQSRRSVNLIKMIAANHKRVGLYNRGEGGRCSSDRSTISHPHFELWRFDQRSVR